MDYSDILSQILGANQSDKDPSALIAALRNQPMSNDQSNLQALGMLGQASGDRVLAPLGQGITQNIDKQQQQEANLGEKRLGLALTLKEQQDRLTQGKQLAQEAEAGRNDRSKEHNDTMAAMRALANQNQNRKTSEREDQLSKKMENDYIQNLTKGLDEFGGRSGLAPYSQTITKVHQLNTLFKNPDGTLKQITPQMLAEGATTLQQAIGAGHVSEGQVNRLVPKTAGVKLAELESYFTGHPEFVKDPGYANQMLEQANNAAATARQRMNKAVLQKISGPLSGISELGSSSARRRLKTTLKNASINPNAFTESGDLRSDVNLNLEDLTPEDEKAIAWARQHTGDPKAVKILEMHGEDAQ